MRLYCLYLDKDPDYSHRRMMLLKDIRDSQILALSLFLVLGIGTRDWTIRPDLIGVVMITCLTTQWLAESAFPNLQRKLLNLFLSREDSPEKADSPLETNSVKPAFRSALITALGLSLLLRADHYTTMALAGFIAIMSKFWFQVGKKHFFNPANFGIISVLLLTQDAWVSPGQWGEDWWYGILFFSLGGLILKRIGRWDTTVAFLGSYALLEAVRNLWLGWTWDVYGHKLMSGSLILFAFFMITDPKSIPNARIGRWIWAISIAGLTFILRNYFFLSTAVFWALFAFAPLTILIDWIWSAPQFSWLTATNASLSATTHDSAEELTNHSLPSSGQNSLQPAFQAQDS